MQSLLMPALRVGAEVAVADLNGEIAEVRFLHRVVEHIVSGYVREGEAGVRVGDAEDNRRPIAFA